MTTRTRAPKKAKRTTRKTEKRADINDPNFWPTLFKHYTSFTGHDVTPTTAMQVSAVYACVKVLSETVASLPFKVYARREGGGRDIAETHALHRVIHNRPNPEQSAFDFWEMLTSHVLLRGNAYSFIERNGAGQVSGLWPLNADSMVIEAVESNTGALKANRYIYTRADGRQISFGPEEIWHLKDLSNDGLSGDSRIRQTANSVGLATALEEHGSKYFKNNASPGVILVYPGRLSEQARKNLKESFDEAHAGSGNAYKTLILEEGLKVEHIGMDMEDSQFLEARQFQVEDIARIFRVPSILIQHPDKTSTYASSEQLMLAFVMHTIRPWVRRIEQSFNNKFLGNKFYAEFSIDGLLRGDVKSRYDAYKIGRDCGFLSANDIRELENLNSIGEKGDEYWRPANMTLAGEPVTKPTDGGGNNAGTE